MSTSSPQQSVRKRLLRLLNRLDGGPVEGAWEHPPRAALLARLTDTVVESAGGLGVHMPHELFVASNGSTPRFGALGRRGRAGGPSRPPLALLGFLAIGLGGLTGMTLEDGVVTLDVAPCKLPPECVGALVLITRAALVRKPSPPSSPRPVTAREAVLVEVGEATPVLSGREYEAWRAAQGAGGAAPRPAPTTFIARLVAISGGVRGGGCVLILEDDWERGTGNPTFPLLLRGSLWPRIASCLCGGERYVFTGVESDDGVLALAGMPCTARWWEGAGGGGDDHPIRSSHGEGALDAGHSRVRDVQREGQTGHMHRLPRDQVDVVGRVSVVGTDFVGIDVEGSGRVVVLCRGAAGALPLAARVGSILGWYRLSPVGNGWGALRPTPVSWACVLTVADGGASDPPPPPLPPSALLPAAGEAGEAAPALLQRLRTLLAFSTVGAAFFPPTPGPACEPWLPPLLSALSPPLPPEGAQPCPLASLRDGLPLSPPLQPAPPAALPLLTPSALAAASLAAAHAALTLLSQRVNEGTPAPWHRVMDNDCMARRAAQGRWDAAVGRAAADAAAGALGAWRVEGLADARVCEGWTRLRLHVAVLAPLLALRYGSDSATGHVTGNDGGVSLPLCGSLPLPPPPRPAPPPVEILPTRGWSLYIDLLPAPLLLAVPPPPPTGWPGGVEPPCQDGLATLTAASRTPPAPRPPLAALLLASLSTLLATPSLDAAVAAGRSGPGGWDGYAADARAVWGGAGGGWAGGWTDLWLTPRWRRELPPTGEGPPPKKQGAGTVAAIQWRARLCLHWEGQGLPRALARLGKEQLSTPCRPGPASHPGASPFWFCPSLPPRVRAARFPHEIGAQTAPGSTPVLLVDASGVLAPGRPTPLPPPPPVLAELANVVTDGRIASKAGDVEKGLVDAGAVRDARARAAGPTCAPSLPAGLATHLALGRPLRLLFLPSSLSPSSRLALDAPTLALQPWVGEGEVPGLADAGATAPTYAEGVAAAAGRATTWPTLPRLLLTVRGALGSVGEVCTGPGGEEEERPRCCAWAEETVGGEGGKEGAPHRPAYDRRTSGGLPPTLALLGKIVAIRLFAEGDEGAPAEGEGGGADGELFGRWAATGPAGRASTQALLMLSHVGVDGEEGGEEDAIALYITLGNARVGGVLPHGFGRGAIVLVSDAMREHGSCSRPFMRSTGGVCTLLAGTARVRQAVALYTLLDAPPPPVGSTLATLAASPALSRCTLALPARPQQLVSLTLAWECSVSGVQCAPVPPATLARAGGLARLAASLLPSPRLFSVPCAPDRIMVRVDVLQRLVEAVAGVPPGRPPPGRRPPPPPTSEPILRLSAEARITDGSGSARLFGSDVYEAIGLGRVDLPPSELGPMTRLLGLGRRALGHFAAAAAALGPLTCAKLFTADTSGVGRGPGWASEEAAGAGGAMLGTWLPQSGGEEDFDPLEANSEERERAYWALLARARWRAAGAAEEWRESGGETGSRKRPRPSGRHPHDPEIVRAVAAALPRNSAIGEEERTAIVWQAAGLESDRRAPRHTLAHLRVPYYHEAAAAGALRLCVLSQLEGRSGPARATALTLTLRPHFRSDFTLPTVGPGSLGPGRAILPPPPFLSRELRWRRDAAMRAAAPLLAARTRLSLFAARDRAALAALDAWQGDVEDAADAQAAWPLQAANTRASFRPALRLAVQAGTLGLAALPGVAGRRPPGLRVLLPAPPTAHRLLPGGESRNMGEEEAGPRPPLSAMPLPQLLYRLVGAA